MLQYFLVLERVDPWPHTVEGLCWLWLAILSGLKALYFKGRDHWNIFLLPLHRIFRLDKVNLCSAVGDLNAEDRKNCLIGIISQVPMLFTRIKNFALPLLTGLWITYLWPHSQERWSNTTSDNNRECHLALTAKQSIIGLVGKTNRPVRFRALILITLRWTVSNWQYYSVPCSVVQFLLKGTSKITS